MADESLLLATDAWRSAFPGARAAVMGVRGVVNPGLNPALEVEKRALETRLRERWAGGTRADIRGSGDIPAYVEHYKRFGQQYHVAMQLESIALKGKTIPARAALAETLFMAELETGLLAAIHDLDAIRPPITVDVATGDERYLRRDGTEEACKSGDMLMRDAKGALLTSVIQGPTTAAPVTDATTAAVFCLYAPAGIALDSVRGFFASVERLVACLAGPNGPIVTTTAIVG